jgi:hypothetical protein
MTGGNAFLPLRLASDGFRRNYSHEPFPTGRAAASGFRHQDHVPLGKKSVGPDFGDRISGLGVVALFRN